MNAAPPRLALPLRQLLEAAILLSSLAVMSMILPQASIVPNIAIVAYYVLVPGYCFSSTIHLTKTIEGTIFFSVTWSLALLVGVSSLESIVPNQVGIPISLVVPAITIFFLLYGHFHRGTEP